MRKFLCAVALAFLMVACAPSTKEDYLAQFKDFISEVNENSSNYTEADWTAKNADYEKFTGEWYDKFEKDLTLEEQMTVGAYITAYNYHKGVNEAGEALKELGKDFEKNVDEISQQAEEGIKELGKQIEEIGEELQK